MSEWNVDSCCLRAFTDQPAGEPGGAHFTCAGGRLVEAICHFFSKSPNNNVLDALRTPREEIDGELRAELASVLYARGALSLGIAREMAQLLRWAFEDLLAKRQVVRT